MTRDGENFSCPSDGHITDTGIYTLRAIDTAGNIFATEFTILIYFDANSLIFFGLFILVLVAVGVNIWIRRKTLKVI